MSLWIISFFLAGSSARWFFDLNVETAIVDIDNSMGAINDVESFVKNLTGSNSEQSVNRLVSFFGQGNEGLVSEYVVRALTMKCELSFVNTFIQQVVKNNPAFHGWMIELQFLANLRAETKNTHLISVLTSEGTESWDVISCQKFEPTEITKMAGLSPISGTKGDMILFS